MVSVGKKSQIRLGQQIKQSMCKVSRSVFLKHTSLNTLGLLFAPQNRTELHTHVSPQNLLILDQCQNVCKIIFPFIFGRLLCNNTIFIYLIPVWITAAFSVFRVVEDCWCQECQPRLSSATRVTRNREQSLGHVTPAALRRTFSFNRNQTIK